MEHRWAIAFATALLLAATGCLIPNKTGPCDENVFPGATSVALEDATVTVTKRVGTISYSCGVEVVLLLDEEPVAWMVLNDEGLGPDMLAGDGLFTGAVTIDPAAPPDEAGVEIFCTCGGECEPCEISGSEPIF